MNNDLISRSELKKAFEHLASDDYENPLWYEDTVFRVIDNAPTIDLKDIYQEGHYDGQLEGYTRAINEERPQGDCENCDYRKFTETFINGIVEVMTKNGIKSVEQLSEILGKGNDND